MQDYFALFFIDPNKNEEQKSKVCIVSLVRKYGSYLVFKKQIVFTSLTTEKNNMPKVKCVQGPLKA